MWINELEIVFGGCPELVKLLRGLDEVFEFPRIGNANCVFVFRAVCLRPLEAVLVAEASISPNAQYFSFEAVGFRNPVCVRRGYNIWVAIRCNVRVKLPKGFNFNCF